MRTCSWLGAVFILAIPLLGFGLMAVANLEMIATRPGNEWLAGSLGSILFVGVGAMVLVAVRVSLRLARR